LYGDFPFGQFVSIEHALQRHQALLRFRLAPRPFPNDGDYEPASALGPPLVRPPDPPKRDQGIDPRATFLRHCDLACRVSILIECVLF
jgi:hypothetical protein